MIAARRHLGNVLRELGEFQEGYTLTSTTLEQARRVLGPEHELTLRVANSFGGDMRARGNCPRHVTMIEESLRLHRAVLGDAHPRTLQVMNNLALDYGLISRYQDSRNLHQRTHLQESEATAGISRAEVLNSWTGLARAVRLCGEYAEARDFGQDAYEYGRQELGAEHPRTLRASKDLSIALRRVGVYDEALEHVPGRAGAVRAAVRQG